MTFNEIEACLDVLAEETERERLTLANLAMLNTQRAARIELLRNQLQAATAVIETVTAEKPRYSDTSGRIARMYERAS